MPLSFALALAALGLLALVAGAVVTAVATSFIVEIESAGWVVVFASFLAPYAACALGIVSTFRAERYAAWRATLWQVAIALAASSFGLNALYGRWMAPPICRRPFGLLNVVPGAQIIVAWAIMRVRHPEAFSWPAAAKRHPGGVRRGTRRG
jgi:hypothetical protein